MNTNILETNLEDFIFYPEIMKEYLYLNKIIKSDL